jgi:signal transduction histidine kinase
MRLHQGFLAILFFLVFSSRAQETKRIETFPVTRLLTIKDSVALYKHLEAALKLEDINADSASFSYCRILLSCIASQYHRGVDTTLMYLHRRYWNKGASRYTTLLLKQCWSYTNKIGSPYIIAHISNDLGIYSMYKGRYEESVFYLNYALKKLNDNSRETSQLRLAVYNNLGSVWGVMHEDGNAVFWLQKAQNLSLQLKDYSQLATIAVNIGATYVNREDWDSAFFYCMKALQLTKMYGLNNTFSTASLNLAQISLQKNKPAEALKFLSEGREKYNTHTAFLKRKSLADSAILPNAVVYDQYEGWAYYLLKDYQKAKDKLLFALQIQTKYGFRNDAMQTEELLYKTLSEMNDYTGAYHHLQNYLAIKDSLNHIEKEKAVDVEIKYRTAEKDKAIAFQQLKIARSENRLQQKNVIVVLIASGALLLIGLILGFYLHNRHKQKLQTQRIRTLQQEHEIGNLKSMMKGEEKERVRFARELHDGIMVELSTIKMKLRILQRMLNKTELQKEVYGIMDQLDHTTKELRKTAHNLMPDMLLEGGLPEAVFYFCKNLQTKDLDINFQQFGEIPRLQQEFELALYRMIQELMQNIIKHAHATKAIVQLSYSNDLLCITIEDNGGGFNLEKDLKGMGLKSLRTRIRALNGAIDINSSEEKGTAVNLEFDVRSVTLNKNKNYA